MERKNRILSQQIFFTFKAYIHFFKSRTIYAFILQSIWHISFHILSCSSPDFNYLVQTWNLDALTWKFMIEEPNLRYFYLCRAIPFYPLSRHLSLWQCLFLLLTRSRVRVSVLPGICFSGVYSRVCTDWLFLFSVFSFHVTVCLLLLQQ